MKRTAPTVAALILAGGLLVSTPAYADPDQAPAAECDFLQCPPVPCEIAGSQFLIQRDEARAALYQANLRLERAAKKIDRKNATIKRLRAKLAQR